jgi:hypothetical protein
VIGSYIFRRFGLAWGGNRVTPTTSPAMLAALPFLVLAAVPSWAAPMQPEECLRSQTEQAALVASGTADDMARGPEWAKDNLSSDRLERVKRWIELEEQILFRCPPPAPPPGEAKTAAQAEEQRPRKKIPLPHKKPKGNDAYRSQEPFSKLEMQHAAPGQ